MILMRCLRKLHNKRLKFASFGRRTVAARRAATAAEALRCASSAAARCPAQKWIR